MGWTTYPAKTQGWGRPPGPSGELPSRNTYWQERKGHAGLAGNQQRAPSRLQPDGWEPADWVQSPPGHCCEPQLPHLSNGPDDNIMGCLRTFESDNRCQALSTALGCNCLTQRLWKSLDANNRNNHWKAVEAWLVLSAPLASSISDRKSRRGSDDICPSNVIEAIKHNLAMVCPQKLC